MTKFLKHFICYFWVPPLPPSPDPNLYVHFRDHGSGSAYMFYADPKNWLEKTLGEQ